MAEHVFQVGDRVWWLHEDTRLYRFSSDLPAVVTHVRRDSLTIEATNAEGRLIAVHVHPEHLRLRDDGALDRQPPPSEVSGPRIEVPVKTLTDLLTVMATTQKWIDTSLAGERANSFGAATILDVMKQEFRQIRAMNEDAMAGARALLPQRS